LTKALSAELSVLALALLLLLSDFNLGFCAKAAPLRPMQAMAMTPVTNRIFMENLFFIGFDKIKGAELKSGKPDSRRSRQLAVIAIAVLNQLPAA
jgi:hypothetical protein